MTICSITSNRSSKEQHIKPKSYWEDIKKKHNTKTKAISLETMMEHYKSLYSKKGETQMPSHPPSTKSNTLFLREDIELGIKKLTN